MVGDNPRLCHRHTTGLSELPLDLDAGIPGFCSPHGPTARELNGTTMVHASAAESVAAGRVGERGLWSMWHSLARWCWVYCSGPEAQSSDSLWRCWADSWVAASEILSGSTAAPSDCWTIRNIRAPFRLVTCRPQRALSAGLSVWRCNRVWPGRQRSECLGRGTACACVSRSRFHQEKEKIYTHVQLLYFETIESWSGEICYLTRWSQNSWVNLVADAL